MGTDDWELFNRWLKGSQVAGFALLDKYRSGWLRYLRKRYAPDSEDIFQQAMLACVEGHEKFRSEGNFGSYVFGILRNQISGHKRQRSREQRIIHSLMFQSITLADPANEDDDQVEAIEGAMARLSPELREVLVMRFTLKMTRERVELTLAIPSGTVASRERRAKAKLFELLAAQPADDGN